MTSGGGYRSPAGCQWKILCSAVELDPSPILLLLLQILHSHPGPYLAIRKQLVNLTLHYAAALQLSQETAHTALALMDRCVMSGIHLADHLQALLVCACLRVAAVQESSFVPAPLAVQALTHIPGEADTPVL